MSDASIIRLNPSKIKAFHRNLQRWYRANGRHDLPWRHTTSPYAIYLSEIMLQQTQVKTVIDRFYQPFLARFPTLEKLAAADEVDVLKAWQGLGYYSRARNLHQAAKHCKNGKLPRTVKALEALPGIGKNTAHAIAAFAFRQPVAVMEANVKRIVARIFALENPSTTMLWNGAEMLLDAENAFDYNQAMMDLGAALCTPRSPKCEICPAFTLCCGRKAPEQYPRRKTKRPLPVRKKTIIVEYDRSGRIFMRPRTTRFLMGYYAFLEGENGAIDGGKSHISEAFLGCLEQTYTHFTLKAEIFTRHKTKPDRNQEAFTLAQAEKLPLAKSEQKILAMLKLKKKTILPSEK